MIVENGREGAHITATLMDSIDQIQIIFPSCCKTTSAQTPLGKSQSAHEVTLNLSKSPPVLPAAHTHIKQANAEPLGVHETTVACCRH